MKLGVKDLVRWLILAVCGCVLGVNVYLTNARNLMHNLLPMPFGYGAAIVLSGSMEPTFSKGDLIIVQEASEFAVDDIVVFQDMNSLVVHRIVEIQDGLVVTKGDANNVVDDAVDVANVKGKVLCWIPAVGTAIGFLKTPAGIALIIGLAILLVILPDMSSRRKDDEERQRIIDEINRLKNDL